MEHFVVQIACNNTQKQRYHEINPKTEPIILIFDVNYIKVCKQKRKEE